MFPVLNVPAPPDSDTPVVFVIGSDAAFLVRALGAADSLVRAIVLTPDAEAAQALRGRFDAPATRDRVTLLSGPDYAGASGIWRPAQLPPDDPPVLIDPAVGQHDPDTVAHAERTVRRIIVEARANAEARRTHAARYLLHTLANAARIAREGDVTSLFGSLRNAPAILVGAGPSLDGIIPELAACRQRSIVIAAATAARPLLSHGVVPHFIVSLDPSEANAMHLAGLHNTRSAWLVAEPSLHPAGLAAFEGRTFFFKVSDHQPWPWLASLGLGRGRLATWGSVATSALDLALGLGCSCVVFAGFDFAFTGGRPYCRGTTFEAQWAAWTAGGQDFQTICSLLVNRWPLTLEPDASGGLVRTAPHLIAFRNWIRERVDATRNVRFVNATPGGILHHPRIDTASFADVLGEVPSFDARTLEHHIHACHRATAGSPDRLFAAILELTESISGGGAGPLPDWQEFCGQSIRRDALLAALRSREYQAWELGRRHALSPDTSTHP